MSDVQFHTMPDGQRLAFRFASGIGPTLVFLPGYMSDMDGGKASATMEWARANGRSCLLLDYSGCGQSDGEFANGTLSRWTEEVLALIEANDIGRVTLIGSSMGGWLMLLIGLALGDKLDSIIGIASAPDFTEWGRSDADKARLAAGETVFDDNPYGPDPTPMHAGFWQDGQAQLLLGGTIDITCPIRLLHGQRDADVPWDISMQLARVLRSDDVQVALIKDGDHRLSRDQDVNLLLRTIAALPQPA